MMKKLQSLVIAGALTLVSTACLKVPDIQKGPIPEFTRRGDWSQWAAKVATFNTWGFPLISKDLKERIPQISLALQERALDLALLQEVWTPSLQRDLRASAGFKDGHAFRVSRTIGSGLMTLSSNLIQRDSFREFTMNGKLTEITEGDAFAGKGGGMITTVAQGLPISVFNTHLIARYGDATHAVSDKHTPDRMLQLFDLFRHVVEQTDSDAFILGGDFNMRVSQSEYAFWRRLTSLEGIRAEESDPSACSYCGDNSYHDNSEGQIDYLFVSPRLSIPFFGLDFNQRFTSRDGRSINLSDHYGWTATLTARPHATRSPEEVRTSTQLAILELQSVLSAELHGLQIEGVEDRVCRSCRIRDGLEALQAYSAALSPPFALPKGERGEFLKTLRMRLDGYFALFRTSP